MKSPGHPAIAVDTVNFAGEAVAVVVARSGRRGASTRSSWSTSSTTTLPVVLDMEAALADGADLVHPDLGTNESAHLGVRLRRGGHRRRRRGRPSRAARDGGVVIERTFRQQRLIPAFMEPRSMVVDPTGEQITMWSATQVPHILRLMLALSTGMPEHKIRVIAPDVGGGFGGKLQVTPEEIVTLRGRAAAGQAGASTPRPAPSRCWPRTTAATRSRS